MKTLFNRAINAPMNAKNLIIFTIGFLVLITLAFVAVYNAAPDYMKY